jgi:shikimate kinase
MMGAGKSTVARLLAAELGCRTVDTDDLIEKRKSRTVAEIFADEGEAAFRAAETHAIAELGDIVGPIVVSVGGGAVLSGANRGALRSLGTVVWLRARPATLARRVGRGEGRPLLAAGGSRPHERLAQLARERQAQYQEVAHLVVDVDDLSSRDVARAVKAALAAPTS